MDRTGENYISNRLRKRILKRDNYTCRYCGDKSGSFHIDHVYPLSKGGETSYDKLVTACESCNLKKHAKVGIWPKTLDGNVEFVRNNISEKISKKQRESRGTVSFAIFIFIVLQIVFDVIFFYLPVQMPENVMKMITNGFLVYAFFVIGLTIGWIINHVEI